jgi:hypothetical protein
VQNIRIQILQNHQVLYQNESANGAHVPVRPPGPVKGRPGHRALSMVGPARLWRTEEQSAAISACELTPLLSARAALSSQAITSPRHRPTLVSYQSARSRPAACLPEFRSAQISSNCGFHGLHLRLRHVGRRRWQRRRRSPGASGTRCVCEQCAPLGTPRFRDLWRGASFSRSLRLTHRFRLTSRRSVFASAIISLRVCSVVSGGGGVSRRYIWSAVIAVASQGVEHTSWLTTAPRTQLSQIIRPLLRV